MASVSIFDTTRFTALASGDVIPAVDISNVSQNAHGSLLSITVTNFFATVPVPIIVTSASANALAVGRVGSTNPVLLVDASTATVATGIKIKGAAAAGGVAVSVITSGTNENLTIDAAGSGTITFAGTSTGNIVLSRTTTNPTTADVGISSGTNAAGATVSRFLAVEAITAHAHYGFADKSTVALPTGATGHAAFFAFNTFSGAGNSEHSHAFQDSTTYAASGTIAEIASFWSLPQMSAGSGTVATFYSYGSFAPQDTGAITTMYGFYAEGSNTRAGTNYAFYSNGTAPSRLGGALTVVGAATLSSTIAVTGTSTLTGNVAVGGATGADRALTVRSNVTLTGTTQYGVTVFPTFASSATAKIAGIQIALTTQAAAFTVTDAFSIYIETPSKGAASAITNAYGLYIENQTAGGTLNYAIRCNGGQVNLSLPTSSAGLTAGSLWSDSGTVKVA